MEKTNIIAVALGVISLVVVGVLVLSLSSLSKSLSAIDSSIGLVRNSLDNLDRFSKTTSFGALTGPDIPYEYITVNGTKLVPQRQSLSASNTPCALQAKSTSTISHVTILNTAQAANDQLWVIGTSTARTATGSVLWSQLSPANAGLSVAVRPMASSTSGITNEKGSTTMPVLRPNDWVNVNVVSTAFNGATELTGYCNIVLWEF